MAAKEDPGGAVTHYKYDTEGNLVQVTDAFGNSICYTYDGTGKCTSETDVLGNRTVYAYTPAGKIERILYPNGTEERRVYKNGQLEKVYKPNGERQQYGYDGNGNIIAVLDGTGKEVRYIYDALDRLVRQETGEGARSFEYDSAGNLMLYMDENGNATRYGHSPNGNLTKVTDALGNETCYSYDCMGGLIKIRQAGEQGMVQETIYERDLEGRVIKTTDPAGYAERYAYDKNGRMAERQDKDGFRTMFRYGEAGDITGISYGDGRSVLLSYDALHHLEEIKDWDGTTKIVTDALGRTLSVTGPDGRKVSYEWGAGGEKRALTYPDGQRAEYSYNARGLLEGLTVGKGTIRYGYDGTGRLVRKELPNGAATSYAYDRQGRIQRICHEAAGFQEDYRYQYDAAGNKIKAEKDRGGIEEGQGCFAYRYDALNRLVQVEKDGERLRGYGYDPFGNRTEKREYVDGVEKVTRYFYNEKNQLLSEVDGGVEKSYQYDRRGNMTGVAVGGEQVRQFTFDAAGRMCSSAELEGGFVKKAGYRYNGLGQRTGQDIWRIKRESANGIGALADVPVPEMPEERIRYTMDLTRAYHNLLSLEVGDRGQDFYWDGNVAAVGEDGEENYYILDDLGSPARLLDGVGGSREAYGYDEFGVDLFGKPGEPCRRQLQPFGFTGYQLEEAGGLYFAQARRYDAGIGRFTSEDFIRGAAVAPYTLNHYGYCWNRPLDLVDLNGLWAEELETAAKAVTKVVALAAIGACIISGGPILALAVVTAAAVAGVISGCANEKIGGSYINGWVGGAIGGGSQTLAGSINPAVFVLGGSLNGVGSAITDYLDNIDPTNNKYKTDEEILRDARTNAMKGMVYSIPGTFMGWAVDSANADIAGTKSLMPSYTEFFGEGLNQFFGAFDNLWLAVDSINGGAKYEEIKE